MPPPRAASVFLAIVAAAVLVLGLFPVSTRAFAFSKHRAWNHQTFPNPQLDPAACGLGQPGYICDPDQVLSTDARSTIAAAIETIEQEIPCQVCQDKRGYQVALAIMQRMENPDSPSLAAQRFTTGIHDQWGVGFSDCQNGIVIAIFLQDRQIYVSTGADAKRVLSDRLVQRLIRHLRPILRSRDFDQAMLEAVGFTRKVLTGEITDSFWAALWEEYAATVLFVAVFLGLLGWTARRQLARQQQYDACRRKLTRIEQERAEALAGQFQDSMCSICLEDLPPLQPSAGTADPDRPEGAAAEEGPATSGEAEPAQAGGAPPPEGAGAAAADPAAAAPEPPKKISLLRCGHRFCEDCIEGWLQHQPAGLRRSCPVCREPMDGERRDPPAPPPAPGHNGDDQHDDEGKDDRPPGGAKDGLRARGQGHQARPGQARSHHVEAELMFRLLRLRLQYPQYITNDMVQNWSASSPGTSFAMHPSFASLNPRNAQQHSSGTSGSRSRFGGGSSFGGGGGGGSW